MGKELFDAFPDETKKASALLGYDLMELCLHGPNNYLQDTQYTQPAIYFISCLAYLRQMRQSSPPAFVLGHSCRRTYCFVCS